MGVPLSVHQSSLRNQRNGFRLKLILLVTLKAPEKISVMFVSIMYKPHSTENINVKFLTNRTHKETTIIDNVN